MLIFLKLKKKSAKIQISTIKKYVLKKNKGLRIFNESRKLNIQKQFIPKNISLYTVFEQLNLYFFNLMFEILVEKTF